jgi:hypothetical protein
MTFIVLQNFRSIIFFIYFKQLQINIKSLSLLRPAHAKKSDMLSL